MAPRAIWCIQLFFGGFFSTGIPTSSYFLAASNRGWEARRPDLARKFAIMGAGRLGGFTQLVRPAPLLLQEPGPTRVVGRPMGSYMGVFYLKCRWALNQEIMDTAAQQGWCPRSAACNSWCIHHPAVCDGRMCTAGTGAGRADGPIWLKNSPKQGLRGMAALSSWCIPPPAPCCSVGSSCCCRLASRSNVTHVAHVAEAFFVQFS